MLKDQSTGAIYCKATGLPCAIQILQSVFLLHLSHYFQGVEAFLIVNKLLGFLKYSLVLSEGWT